MILQEKLRPYRLLLASHSPRRQQLLRDCGLDYTLIDRYEVEERYPAGLPPHDVPLFLSQLKSDAYPEPLAANDILLTADTVVVAAGGILGKPHDRDEAVGMLHRLSGAEHFVTTGVTLRTVQRRYSFAVTTAVRFPRARGRRDRLLRRPLPPLRQGGRLRHPGVDRLRGHRKHQRFVLQRHGTARPAALRRARPVPLPAGRLMLRPSALPQTDKNQTIV